MSIVILGGSGFIGRQLVRLLTESGETVTVVSRRPPAAVQQDIRYVRGDIADSASINRYIEGASVVFHLATGSGTAWSDFERDFLQGTHNVATACLDYGVSRLIYTSSIAALYLGGRDKIDESTGVDPKPHRRAYYSRAKIHAEQILMDFRSKRGLPVVILRPGVVMGPGRLNHSGIGMWVSDTCCIGWGRGKTRLPLVLASDVASALVAAMRTPNIEGQCFNIVGDIRMSASEFVSQIAKCSLRNFRFYPRMAARAQALEIIKWFLKAIARRPGNEFPSMRDLKSRALVSEFDCTAAHHILNWHPTTDWSTFRSEAIDSSLRPVLAGDLRVTEAS
jgi:nucleoside-diphosphate-sugar epimerase